VETDDLRIYILLPFYSKACEILCQKLQKHTRMLAAVKIREKSPRIFIKNWFSPLFLNLETMKNQQRWAIPSQSDACLQAALQEQ
jgi:hypothetical protein